MARVADFLTRFRPAPAGEVEIGIGGFTAFARVRDSYKLAADAPIIPVENGSFVNDHIIRKPVTLSIEGDVSDIHIRRSPAVQQQIRDLAELGNLTAQFAPSRTQAQLSKIAALANDIDNAIARVDSVLAAGAQAANYLGNQDTGSKPPQEMFLDTVEAYYFAGSLISIDMPYRRHDNMVITSFTSTTDNEGNSTGFTLEAQQLQLVDLQFVQLKKPAGGTGGQLAKPADKGAQEGKPVPVSLLGHLLGG